MTIQTIRCSETVCAAELGIDIVATCQCEINRDVTDIAYSTATINRESIHCARLTKADFRFVDAVLIHPGFRPSIAASNGQSYVAFIGPHYDRLAPFIWTPGQEAIPLLPPGLYSRVEIIGTNDALVVACCEVNGTTSRIHVGSFTPQHLFETALILPGRDVALSNRDGSPFIAWIDGDAIFCGAMSGGKITGEQRLAEDARAEALALAINAQGDLGVAWHARLAGGVLCWPRLIIASANASNRCDPPVLESDTPSTAADAGTNQGWEFPALGWDARGRIWLAGRSSQGHRVQCWAAGQWSARLDLAPGDWGGRGHRSTLIPHSDGMIFVRGTPQGTVAAMLDLVGGSTT